MLNSYVKIVCPCCDYKISSYTEGVNFVDYGILDFMQIPLVEITCPNDKCNFIATIDIGKEICEAISSRWNNKIKQNGIL